MLLKLTSDEAYEFLDAATIAVERLEDALDELPLGTTLPMAQTLQSIVDTNIRSSTSQLYVFIPLINSSIRYAAVDAINLNLEHYDETLADNVFIDEGEIIRSVELSESIKNKLSRF